MNHKLYLLAIICFGLSSCLCFDIMATSTSSTFSELESKLDICHSYTGTLFGGGTNVSGTVESSHYKTIYGVEFEMTVYGDNGSVIHSEIFELGVNLSANGKATFDEFIPIKRKNISRIAIKLHAAHD